MSRFCGLATRDPRGGSSQFKSYTYLTRPLKPKKIAGAGVSLPPCAPPCAAARRGLGYAQPNKRREQIVLFADQQVKTKPFHSEL